MAKKILIIDDEKDMRVYLKTLFSKAGYEIETAANGDEGVVAAEQIKPDLITLDVLMPKKSGVKAYQSLRTSPGTRQIPVVILTGLTRREDFFGDLGDLPKPDAVVEKPIDREAFLAQIAEILGT
jgi:CheY-like chemotaxis protein